MDPSQHGCVDGGFYRCDRWPWWFTVSTSIYEPRRPLNIWGFSIWKNVAGYRTLGVPLEEWLCRPEQIGIRIEKDHDRTQDKAWLKAYRAEQRQNKESPDA